MSDTDYSDTDHFRTEDCDALVLFGASGDLAYKMIFPALQALIKRRRLSIPVIGVEFGYTDVPIADLKPDRLIGHMGELPAAVEILMDGGSIS